MPLQSQRQAQMYFLKTKAIKKEDHYLVSGSKTFITNGVHADFIVAAVRTGNEGYDGIHDGD